LGTLEALLQEHKTVLLCCTAEQLHYCKLTCKKLTSKQFTLNDSSILDRVEKNKDSQGQILWIPVSHDKEGELYLSKSLCKTLYGFLQQKKHSETIPWLTLYFQGCSGQVWNPQEKLDYPIPFEKCVTACELLEGSTEEGFDNAEIDIEALQTSFAGLQKFVSTLF